MHYLKCTHCEHLNPLKTQYLVFCAYCNKKLRNNFSDWKKANPKKSFEDFINTVSLSQAELEKQEESVLSETRYKAGRKTMLILMIVIAVIVLLGFFYFYWAYLKGVK